jgi:hypothetical protein
MGSMSKRLAVLLLLIAALTNGLFGPLAHGHAVADAGGRDAPQIAAAADPNGEALHAACHGTEPADEDASPGGGHAGGKHPAKSGLLCSGSAACCAAVAVVELPIVEQRERVAPGFSLRPVLIGLTPPVGERPPSRL